MTVLQPSHWTVTAFHNTTRSAGLNRLSLRNSSALSNSCRALLFTCLWRRSSCFSAASRMASSMVLILRSVWSFEFRWYHSALVISYKILFWQRCIIRRLVFFVQPQSWIPYIQIGRRIVWYTRRLLYRSRPGFRPISQYSWRIVILIWAAFCFTWCFQFSRESKCMPKYFAESVCGTSWLLI